MAPPAWFHDVFGFTESRSYRENQARFSLTDDLFLRCASIPEAHGPSMFVGSFATPALGELRARVRALQEQLLQAQRHQERERAQQQEHTVPQRGFNAASGAAATGEGLRFEHVTTTVGVQALIGDPTNAGAVFQAASQFNCLEMVGPKMTPADGVANYFLDPTQVQRWTRGMRCLRAKHQLRYCSYSAATSMKHRTDRDLVPTSVYSLPAGQLAVGLQRNNAHTRAR